MKEEKFKTDSFIGGWYIDTKVCDELVSYFEENVHRHHSGRVGSGVVEKDTKTSTDMTLYHSDTLLDKYNEQLQFCLEAYMKHYPEVDGLAKFSTGVEDYNIQRYEAGEGFFKWHAEVDSKERMKRCLVFMTYLNNVKKGGTHFKYQNVTTQAKKGLTLIWPAQFTHMHKGQIASSRKYIITGWYNFL